MVAAGRANEGACAVEGWRERAALACGDWHSVGVCADGTAVATGINRRGQCAVSDWTGLTGIAAGYLHTLGVTAGGRVLVGSSFVMPTFYRYG